MKKFLTIIILSLYLITPSQADDISEFELEGVSVGQSLLDYADKKKIKTIKSEVQYPNDKFTIYYIGELIDLKQYDFLTATTKKNDNNYTITSIGGGIYFSELDKCLNLKKNIQVEIEKIFKKTQKDEVKYKSSQDKTGKSTVYGVQYYFKPYPSVEAISVNCYDMSSESNTKKNLKVAVHSEEFAYFLINEAYK